MFVLGHHDFPATGKSESNVRGQVAQGFDALNDFPGRVEHQEVMLAKDGDIASFFAYLALTVAGGIALVIAGTALGRRMVPGP